jgi:hypothetical protein
MPRGERELAEADEHYHVQKGRRGEREGRPNGPAGGGRGGAEPQLFHRPTCRHPAFIAGQR